MTDSSLTLKHLKAPLKFFLFCSLIHDNQRIVTNRDRFLRFSGETSQSIIFVIRNKRTIKCKRITI